jgi:Tol biopolymer transport system component
MFKMLKKKRKYTKLFLSAFLVMGLLLGAVATPNELPFPAALAQESLGEGKMAVVGLDGAALTDEPGGRIIRQLAPGDVLMALGRTRDGAYLQVETERKVRGWVATRSVVIFGVEMLPVVEQATPTPTATPTPAPTLTPTPTSTPTSLPPTSTPAQPSTQRPASVSSPTAMASPASATVTPTASAQGGTSLTTRSSAPLATESGVLGIVIGTGAQLYDKPEGEALVEISGAEAVTAVGRNADASWLMVRLLNGRQGWMKAADVVIFGVEELPIIAGEGEVAAEATEAPTEEATAVPAATSQAPATPMPVPAAVQATPEAVMTGVVNVTGTRLNIRSGPGTTYRIIGKAVGGETLSLTARNKAGDWLLILRDDLPNGAGWVAASLVRAEGDLDALPVSTEEFSSPASAPAPLNTPAATASPAKDAATPAVMATPSPAASPAAQPAMRTTGATGLSAKIVFQDGRGAIYVYDLARNEVRFLTNGFDPAISRDGRKVAFVRDGIYSIDIDGSNERKVYGGNQLITSPKWSPDGQWIVFSRLLGEYKCFDTEFFGCVSLKELSGRFPNIPPAILGRIFLRNAERISLPNFGLSRVNAEGKEFRDIAALDSALAPDWNEAGIVYQSKAGLEITQDTPDGDTRSVQNGHWDWDPDWAPNGGRIVYQSKEGPRWEILSINPDGSGLVYLTRPVTTLVDQLPSNVAPAFSYDGRHIVYLSNRNERNDAGPWRLWVMDADGSNQRPLPIDIEINYGFGGEQVADWGP